MVKDERYIEASDMVEDEGAAEESNIVEAESIAEISDLVDDECAAENSHVVEDKDKKGILDGETPDDRQLCVLVLASVGRSISKPTTIHELISATRTAIKGHQEIYQKGRILHRDISTNNIRIRDPPKVFGDGIDEESTQSPDEGFLIDFDLSVINNRDDENRSERLARTGTFSFMAWQILDNINEPSRMTDHPKVHYIAISMTCSPSSGCFCTSALALQRFLKKKTLDSSHASSEVMELFLAPTSGFASSQKRVFLLDSRKKIWVAKPFIPMFALSNMRALLNPDRWNDLTHEAFISILT
ncbi:hypothetical protein FRC02_000760 [Tulasnella sp. 418]|nr:hypothetical protein FRC02_000760 [Tulasnella sp. 418]